MVRVITVEREYGSQGAEFAHRLADRLNWKLIDRCLIDEIAHKAGVPQSMAEQCDERLDPWYYRMGKSFWHGSVDRLPAPPKDQVFDSERMVEFVRNYLKQCVADGNCVIVGRGAACAMAIFPGSSIFSSTRRCRGRFAGLKNTFRSRQDTPGQSLRPPTAGVKATSAATMTGTGPTAVSIT